MERTRKRAEGSEEGEGPDVGGSTLRPADTPEDGPAEPASMPRRERKVKRTYSLRVELARLIDAVAIDLGIDACDLVDELMTAALKGCRKPTVPTDLKALMSRRKRSAA